MFEGAFVGKAMDWGDFASLSLAINKVTLKLVVFALFPDEAIQLAFFKGTFVVSSIEVDFAL